MVNKKYKKPKKSITKKIRLIKRKLKGGLIPIDKYLVKELSKGPGEKKGTIGYHYQHYDNIYNYFFSQLDKKDEFEMLCIPNFVLNINNILTRTAVGYIIESNKLFLPDNMLKKIKKCINNKKKKTRFIYFTFIIITKSINELTHANICIIDNKRKTLERFEPHGKYYKSGEISNKIDKQIEETLMRIIELNNYKYLSPCDISPITGIQKVADSYDGMCITISMMYFHLRLINPDIEPVKIIKKLLKMPKQKLRETILRYAKTVEKILKKNGKIINKLNSKIS